MALRTRLMLLLADEDIAILRLLAEALGYTSVAGRMVGQGSISALLRNMSTSRATAVVIARLAGVGRDTTVAQRLEVAAEAIKEEAIKTAARLSALTERYQR